MNIFNDIFFSKKLSELEERIEKLEEYIVKDWRLDPEVLENKNGYRISFDFKKDDITSPAVFPESEHRPILDKELADKWFNIISERKDTCCVKLFNIFGIES